MIENLALGFSIAFSLQNLAYCFGGVALGTLIGVLPGISPLVAIGMGLYVGWTGARLIRRAVGGLVVQAIDVLDPWAPALLGGARRVRVWHTAAAPFAWDAAADAGTFVLEAGPAGTRLVFAAPLRARVLRVEKPRALMLHVRR